MQDQKYTFVRKREKQSVKNTLRFVLLCAFFYAFFHYGALELNKPPKNFPIDTDIVIEEGWTQSQITDNFSEQRVVRSSFLLHVALVRFFEDKFVLAGTYRFPTALTTKEVARSITTGEFKSPTFKLVLPEGFSVKDFYTLLPPGYVVEDKIDLTLFEGYLFPDTYFITNSMSIDQILSILKTTMAKKLQPYEEVIQQSKFTKDEVLTLASIIEREANDDESMKLVSGILQNRLEIGMPLQVDATLDYILNKTSAELTTDDLALESPFNTYFNKGLPPHPIANPGLKSIEAVLYPTDNEYLYYLTGDNGKFYYAHTFDEHKLNKDLYLQ